MTYNKFLFIDNVYDLAKKRHIKIGKLEKECGVSLGYFSRLRQGNKNVAPGADFLLAVSEMLSVSVDALLTFDFCHTAESESELLRYIEKLTTETQNRKLVWEEDFCGYLDAVPVNPDGTTPHPLFCTVPADGRESSPFYFSPFNPKRRDLVPLKTYGCVFPEHKTLYLVRLSDSGGNWEELELIMTGRELPAGIPLAHTSHEKPARLDAILKHLFAAVEDAAALPQLTPEAKEVIMNYLNEENVHGQET